MQPSSNKPIVWTIAGSDSGGGAGIQADLATMSNLGCHACSVISSVTAQNSVSVKSVESVSNAMFIDQLDALLADMPPQAIKIGLLASQSQVEQLALWFAEHLDETVAVILDPVMVATCGDALTGQNDKKDSGQGISALDFTPLLEYVTLMTPNKDELAQLIALYCSSDRNPVDIETDFSWFTADAELLAKTLKVNLLAKGGDLMQGETQTHKVQDYFVCRQASGVSKLHQQTSFILSSPRQKTNNRHGTGCTLSSAIAAVMAQGYVLHDAIVLAKAYINQGLGLSYQPGEGPGPLGRGGWPKNIQFFPTLLQSKASSCAQRSCDPNAGNELTFTDIDESLGLYPVVDTLEHLQSLLIAGAKTIQLRVKTEGSANVELADQIASAVSLGRSHKARVFINDHWQLAIELGAYGVHLGQEDLYSANLQMISDAGLALGVSTHSYFEALLAHQVSPSYIAFGHIFPTQTKEMPSSPQGLDKLSRYAATFGEHYPCVAIGGINLNNLEQVKQTGIADVAVVSAITKPAAGTTVSDAFTELNRRWHYEGGLDDN